MTELYLICFFVGLALTIIMSLFGGGHGHHIGIHIGHGDAGGATPFSFNGLLAFLTGFGGVGYLLTKVGLPSTLLILLIAVVVGVVLAWFLFLFFVNVILRGERVLQESDYELEGTLAYVSVTIPTNGAGEVKYVLQGTKRSIGARSEAGAMIPKDRKVIITRVEKGMALVIPMEEV